MSGAENRDRLLEAIDALPHAALRGLLGRSMLLTREWSEAELDATLGLAALFLKLDGARVETPLFRNQLFAALFLDASTRTKSSWAGAAARLGAQAAIFDGTTLQLSHGETPAETGAMLGMNSHALGIRHDLILGEGNRFMREAQGGIQGYLDARRDPRAVPLVNLQCDVDHPTQAIADLSHLWSRLGKNLRGTTVAVSWAYSPSYAKPLSVPQGLLMLLSRFGVHLRLAHPPGYDLLPECVADAKRFAAASGGSFVETDDMDEAMRGADVVYPKSWGPLDLMQERVAAKGDAAAMRAIEARALERNARHKGWIADERRMALTRDGRGLYMHCLPADIGAEVSPGVMERHRFDVAEQANHKVYGIMALLAAAKEKELGARLRACVLGR